MTGVLGLPFPPPHLFVEGGSRDEALADGALVGTEEKHVSVSVTAAAAADVVVPSAANVGRIFGDIRVWVCQLS